MKRFFYMLTLLGGTMLNTACAEEAGDVRPAAPVHQDAGAAPGEPLVLAQNTATTKNTSAGARETGTTRTAVDLMATPYRDAKPAGQLAANTTVDILERRGGWLRISAKGKSGWAKLHQVRSGEGPEARAAGGGVAILKNVSQTGRSGSQGIVATTGIRGMSAEELQSAKPDPAAVKKIDGFGVTSREASEYAKAAGLREKKVPPLPGNQ